MSKQDYLIEILKSHRGENQAICSQELSILLDIKDRPGTRNTRTFIKNTIEDYHLPVGATEKGYFWITTPEERDRYLDGLERRIEGIKRRKAAVIIGCVFEVLEPPSFPVSAEEAGQALRQVMQQLAGREG